MLWPHTLDQLIQFMTHMNEANSFIQFTHEYNQEEIVFLDIVVVYKDKNHLTDTLHKRTHIKPTNKQLYVREDCKGVTIGEATNKLKKRTIL